MCDCEINALWVILCESPWLAAAGNEHWRADINVTIGVNFHAGVPELAVLCMFSIAT